METVRQTLNVVQQHAVHSKALIAIPRPHRLSSSSPIVLARAQVIVNATSSTLSPPTLTTTKTPPQTKPEEIILECLQTVTGRGKEGMTAETQTRFDAAVARLESPSNSTGIAQPSESPLLEGRWRLLYTSRPGTASPIQRSFTAVDAFTIYQEIILSNATTPRVNNIVDFGDTGYLKVEAEASTQGRPLPNFTPRQSPGLPFGFLGVSSTAPPLRPGIRVDFQFDRAAFYFKLLPFTIPYPVPFRLLGDERKGFIDVTYMSKDGTFRLSRGNKGTLFVLVKDDLPKTNLLKEIKAGANANGRSRSDQKIEALIEETIKISSATTSTSVRAPAKSAIATGAWRLVWSKQGAKANPLQQRLSQVVRNWQIISGDGKTLENRVEILPGVRVRALADASPASASRTTVVINKVVVDVAAGLFVFELPVARDAVGYVDWLYLDEGMRITKGNKGSVFIHVRDPGVSA